MEEIDVPSYFLCPISFQIMRDPVTLPTGITYDRQSIERWLFSDKRSTCPMTQQSIHEPDAVLTPNHTLRRLIQFWCAANSEKGVERFPTPRPPVDKETVRRILDDVRKPQLLVQSLRKLKELVAISDRNKRCAESAGAAKVLVDVVRNSVSNIDAEEDYGESRITACDEALNVLHSLQMPDESLRDLVAKEEDFLTVLMQVLKHSDCQSRTYATFLLKSALKALRPIRLTAVDDRLFVEIVKVLGDHISYNATKVALRVLGELCSRRRNRIQASRAGAVRILIELLLEDPEKGLCGMIMIVLHQLCGCAEGRQELLRHGAGIAVVAGKMVKVSRTASERGVMILHAICKYSATPALLQDMRSLGVVSKLCQVLHVECGGKTKEKAEQMLRLHSSVWRNSPCIDPRFQPLFP